MPCGCRVNPADPADTVRFSRLRELLVQIVDGDLLEPEELDAANEIMGEIAQELEVPFEAVKAKPPTPAFTPDPASKTPTLDRLKDFDRRIVSGEVGLDEYRATFNHAVQHKALIQAEIDKLSKDAIVQRFRLRHVSSSDKKAEYVTKAMNALWWSFVLREGFTITMILGGRKESGEDPYIQQFRKEVESYTEADLAAYAARVKAARQEMKDAAEERRKRLIDPQTLTDFTSYFVSKSGQNVSERDAYMELTPVQRARYDALKADEARQSRELRQMYKTPAPVAAPTQQTQAEIQQTKHTKYGYPLFVVQLSDRLSKDDYGKALSGAKRLGGWYSSFRGGGAIPGFQFKTRDNAEAYAALMGGDAPAARAQMDAKRDAYADDRTQSTVERLREMADRTEADAQEQLSRDRKTNTPRRGRMVSSMIDRERDNIALARSMRNLAQGIEEGKIKYLNGVRARSHVKTLVDALREARHKELQAQKLDWHEREKRINAPATSETVAYAWYPTYSAYQSDLASLARQMIEEPGLSRLGTQLMKIADDSSSQYRMFAAANVYRVAYQYKGKPMVDLSQREADSIVKHFKGKAIAVAHKMTNKGIAVVLSAAEAAARKIWDGGEDKMITLTRESGDTLVERLSPKGSKSKISVPWHFQTTYDYLRRLDAMGLQTPYEFRAGLREFVALQEHATGYEIRKMELAMVGRTNDGLDFFPTSPAVVAQMIEAAELEPEHRVLEPSAGLGHIADAIRETGAEPDVCELSHARAELLDAKGYNLVADDFLTVKARTGFTFGDTFRAPDGTEGVMSKSGGMGSDRVMLSPDGRTGTWYNRDELTPVRHSKNSGYDRILMNPPFSKRRDVEHVMHAYTLLNPGGRIVALLGEGVFLGSDKKAQAFREWMESVGAVDEKLPHGSFTDPSLPVNTGTSARLVIIDKEP